MNWSAEGDDDQGERRRSKMQCVADQFEPDNPPVALVWDFTIQGDPSLRVPFRLENIPLPALPGDLPESPARPEAARTGVLFSSVFLGQAPATAGEVAFGLSRRGANGAWGPVRWQNADVDERGAARLEDVSPGTYRVQRIFRLRAADGTLRPPSGKWLNATVVVQVQAGKTLTLPPLKQTP
jgi:hypothetical protein